MRKVQKLLALSYLMIIFDLGWIASAEDFTVRIGAGHPKGPAPYVTTVSDVFVKSVEERVLAETDHTVHFIEAYGGSLAGVSETLEAVQYGILDFGAYCVCFEPSKLFLHNFPYYEPFGPESSVDAIAAARIVYDENPWLTDMLSQRFKQKLLGLGAWDNYHLGTKTEWKDISDLAGVKLGGAGPNLPWLKYVGVVPVQSSLPEGYLAMKTGVYDGWLAPPAAYNGFKYYEPSPNYTLIGFGAMPVNILTVNEKRFAALPAEIQRIIIEEAKAWEEGNGTAMDASQANGLRMLRENGANIVELPAGVRREWAESLSEFPREKMLEAERRGEPAFAVMQSYIRAAETVGHVWPVHYKLD
ncbi:MAG: C4-dicarboxylate TRAP transporter substrate-binding protein [Henriciella sp.]